MFTEDSRRVNYIIGETDRLYHIAAFKLGVPDSTMAVLYAICGEGRACPISHICRLTGISKQTANSAIRKLEKEDIVKLTAIDGKQKSVDLTAKGRELAEKTAEKVIAAENKVFEAWSEQERKEYIRLNQLYLDSFGEEIKKL